jgi:hypothetical protein
VTGATCDVIDAFVVEPSARSLDAALSLRHRLQDRRTKLLDISVQRDGRA